MTEKQLKLLWKSLVIVLAFWGLIYGMGAFVSLDFNPASWDVWWRGMAAFIASVSAILIPAVVFDSTN